MTIRPDPIVALLGLALAGTLACRSRGAEVVVFHATSLTQALGDAAELFERENPPLRVRLEPSGSQLAARKVAELGLRADVVAVADAAIIERVLVPGRASYALAFATSEIVIAHKDHSRFTDEISTRSWPEILLRPGVRLGRVDPDTAPLGYQTLLAWRLAERSGAYGDLSSGLAARLAGLGEREQVVADETELLGLLESGAIDYAFLYRSAAEDHHLKITALPPDQAAPSTCGLTIPAGAPSPTEARRFVALLLGDKGRRILERRGFRPLAPARCAPCVHLPEELRPLVSSGP